MLELSLEDVDLATLQDEYAPFLDWLADSLGVTEQQLVILAVSPGSVVVNVAVIPSQGNANLTQTEVDAIQARVEAGLDLRPGLVTPQGSAVV
eukprot:scaffold422169_cov24-Prasinocladus_malaysianus.AAC.1